MHAKTADKIVNDAIEILNEQMPEFKFTRKAGSFGSETFTMKIDVIENGSEEEIFDRQLKESRLDLDIYYGQVVYDQDGTKYTIVGIEPTRRKYPIVCQLNTGQQKLLTVSYFLDLLEG